MSAQEGPDPNLSEVSLTVAAHESRANKPRVVPDWVNDPLDSARVWSVYNRYLRGEKPYRIAEELGCNVKTVYSYIEKARAELPYEILGRAEEMISIRMQWIQASWSIFEEIKDSRLRVDRKAEQMAKLLNATGAWVTAIEELTGARRSNSSRINIHAGGDGPTALVFDMDKLMQLQEQQSARGFKEPPQRSLDAPPFDVIEPPPDFIEEDDDLV